MTSLCLYMWRNLLSLFLLGRFSVFLSFWRLPLFFPQFNGCHVMPSQSCQEKMDSNFFSAHYLSSLNNLWITALSQALIKILLSTEKVREICLSASGPLSIVTSSVIPWRRYSLAVPSALRPGMCCRSTAGEEMGLCEVDLLGREMLFPHGPQDSCMVSIPGGF